MKYFVHTWTTIILLLAIKIIRLPMGSLRCKALEHFLVVKARTMCGCSRITVCELVNDYCDHYANAHGRPNGNLQCVQSLS